MQIDASFGVFATPLLTPARVAEELHGLSGDIAPSSDFGSGLIKNPDQREGCVNNSVSTLAPTSSKAGTQIHNRMSLVPTVGWLDPRPSQSQIAPTAILHVAP